MTILEKFKCNYSFKEIYTVDYNIKSYLIPSEDNDRGHLIEVTDNLRGGHYILIIDSGDINNIYNYPRLDMIVTSSNPDRIFAIFGNIGFNINCQDPKDYFILADNAIIKFVYQSLLNEQFVVCYNTEIVAYNDSIILWKIELDEEIIMDQYYVHKVNDCFMTIKYYDFRKEEEVLVKYNLADGSRL